MRLQNLSLFLGLACSDSLVSFYLKNLSDNFYCAVTKTCLMVIRVVLFSI